MAATIRGLFITAFCLDPANRTKPALPTHNLKHDVCRTVLIHCEKDFIIKTSSFHVPGTIRPIRRTFAR